jgi:hypothetical protein
MQNRPCFATAFIALLITTLAASAEEKFLGTYGQARTSLTFKIPDATVQTVLPQGWVASPFSGGPAEGANLVVTFFEWLVVQDPDGKPGKTYRLVGLSVPAKQNGKEATVVMVVAGLSSPDGYAPGPYGNFAAAKAIINRTLRVDDDGVSRAEENWQFEGESGDSIQLQLQFVRGTAARREVEAKVHSASKPEFYRIYRIEEAVDVIRSAPGGTDRVQNYAFKASGPRLSALFKGSEHLISITSFPWYSRRAFLPISRVD